MSAITLRKALLFIISVIILVATLLLTQRLMSANADKQMPPPPNNEVVADVSVSWQNPAEYQSQVKTYGAVEPHYQMTLTAKVSGHVAALSEQFEVGQHINQQGLLARIDDTDYRAALAEAEQTLASAKVALLEEQREGKQALLEWKASGLSGEPDSELVLREPQLAAAEAEVRHAQSMLASAKKDLAYTTLSAPFDAIITDRLIAPGSYVQAGEDIASLNSTDRVEIPLSLSAKEWLQLPALNQLIEQKWPVTISSIDTGISWQGYVLRAQQHVDESTRQQQLIVAVDAPFSLTSPLLPGTFVNVSIEGATQSGLWKLPNSALSQRGEVWYVTEQNMLDKFSASPRFSRDGFIYIDVPAQFNQQAVAVLTHPLNSYISGMKVKPQEADNG
jgi:RND family efflux transporter MFP subunit